MDDNTAIVLAAAVTAIPGIVASVFSYLAVRTGRASVAVSQDNATKLETMKGDIHTIEKATNGMKDALVEATAIAERSIGRDEERTRSDEKATAMAITAMQAVAVVAASATPAASVDQPQERTTE